ncbi:hypothetical protein IJI02_00410 [Candidatus Saccharibacteria bacterium]|nr:hypothetical protein [Candidatus Saccharibacteria bacterium]
MRAVIVYREHSDYVGLVEEFLEEFYRRTGKHLEVIDPDSRDGQTFCHAYDVVEYPTILGLDDLGKVLARWRGLPVPTINAVSYYATEGPQELLRDDPDEDNVIVTFDDTPPDNAPLEIPPSAANEQEPEQEPEQLPDNAPLATPTPEADSQNP